MHKFAQNSQKTLYDPEIVYSPKYAPLFREKKCVFFKLIDRYSERVGFESYIHGRDLLELSRFPECMIH